MQYLLLAKSKLDLSNFIKRLDKYEVLVINDISCISYAKEESDLLFILLAELYEQRSLVITSNFSFFLNGIKYSRIKMTSTTAIDRLLNHATILELNTKSYRMNAAKIIKKYSHKSTKKERKSDVTFFMTKFW